MKTCLMFWFSRTKHGTDNVIKTLKRILAEAIHGDKSKMQDNDVLDAFTKRLEF
jgi:superfamily II DNA/RNA helicase